MPARLPRPPPFPTRRSSDLHGGIGRQFGIPPNLPPRVSGTDGLEVISLALLRSVAKCGGRGDLYGDGRLLCDGRDRKDRSEEHTSELQSRPHLVCRLLLENK